MFSHHYHSNFSGCHCSTEPDPRWGWWTGSTLSVPSSPASVSTRYPPTGTSVNILPSGYLLSFSFLSSPSTPIPHTTVLCATRSTNTTAQMPTKGLSTLSSQCLPCLPCKNNCSTRCTWIHHRWSWITLCSSGTFSCWRWRRWCWCARCSRCRYGVLGSIC